MSSDAMKRHNSVFEGKPDARHAPDLEKPSRFRPQYRALSDDEKALHDAIKAKAMELEALMEQVKPGRYPALAMTSLEEAVMWIIKGLTA